MGKEVSTKALSCPHCGILSPAVSPKKPDSNFGVNSKINDVLAMILIVFFIGLLIYGVQNAESIFIPTTQKKETRTQILDKQFSSWDGSHPGLLQRIKNSMNDPDSYDHVKTIYWDKVDHLIVQTTFRGKNAFGGIVLHSVKAEVDLSGNVLKILSKN